MKKMLLIIAAAMMVAASATAQENGYESKHEVGISYGFGSNSRILDAFEDVIAITTTAGTIKTDNDSWVGPISVEYFYRPMEWLGVGGIVAYESMKQDVFLGGSTKDGEAKNTYLTVMPAVKLDWLRKAHFGMYSKFALGATLRSEKVDLITTGESSESEWRVNWQASLLGFEAGSPTVRGFAELGTGEQGIFLVGLRCKFGN